MTSDRNGQTTLDCLYPPVGARRIFIRDLELLTPLDPSMRLVETFKRPSRLMAAGVS